MKFTYCSWNIRCTSSPVIWIYYTYLAGLAVSSTFGSPTEPGSSSSSHAKPPLPALLGSDSSTSNSPAPTSQWKNLTTNHTLNSNTLSSVDQAILKTIEAISESRTINSSRNSNKNTTQSSADQAILKTIEAISESRTINSSRNSNKNTTQSSADQAILKTIEAISESRTINSSRNSNKNTTQSTPTPDIVSVVSVTVPTSENLSNKTHNTSTTPVASPTESKKKEDTKDEEEKTNDTKEDSEKGSNSSNTSSTASISVSTPSLGEGKTEESEKSSSLNITPINGSTTKKINQSDSVVSTASHVPTNKTDEEAGKNKTTIDDIKSGSSTPDIKPSEVKPTTNKDQGKDPAQSNKSKTNDTERASSPSDNQESTVPITNIPKPASKDGKPSEVHSTQSVSPLEPENSEQKKTETALVVGLGTTAVILILLTSIIGYVYYKSKKSKPYSSLDRAEFENPLYNASLRDAASTEAFDDHDAAVIAGAQQVTIKFS